MAKQKNFYAVVTEAVVDILDHGFDTAGRLTHWQEEIEKAARRTLRPEKEVDADLRAGLGQIYERLIDKGQIAQHHPGIDKFTLEKLEPFARKELNKRIVASADLVKRHRRTAIDKTIQRFSGWASSVPAGGTEQGKKAKIKADIGKALKSLPFEDRRLLIDQGHKLTASINEVYALQGGAIAGIWHSRWKQPGYDYREEHRERDGLVYLLKESWAREKGLVKPGKAGFYEDVTRVGEEPFCRCSMVWIYYLRDLPDDMLTAKGKSELARVRAELSQ